MESQAFVILDKGGNGQLNQKFSEIYEGTVADIVFLVFLNQIVVLGVGHVIRCVRLKRT